MSLELPELHLTPLGEEGMCSHHPSTGGPHFWMFATTTDGRVRAIYCKHCGTETIVMQSEPKS